MKSLLKSYFCISLLALILIPLISCARDELPPFDYEKAKQLSPEKRREYDVIFFNEVAVWNMNSNRYGPGVETPYIGRDAEFRRMAADGYLPAYAALRLLDIRRGNERDDPEALSLLLKAAEAGDASAMCAFMAIPFKRSMLSDEKRVAISRGLTGRGSELRHPACMARKGAGYLLGVWPSTSKDIKAAMPLLLESARQGYYDPAYLLFSSYLEKALSRQFDFSDLNEFKRSLCWGRLAQQHTNWAGFSHFLGLLQDYARENDRPDLLELSYPYDPRRVPITQTVVKPEDCIQLEQRE